MSEKDTLFKIETSIGTIKTTDKYWELIGHKHHEIKDLLSEVKNTLEKPDQIRKSKIDKTVYLFYKKQKKYWLAIVTKKLNHEGFIITAYLTNKIKEGEVIWTK